MSSQYSSPHAFFMTTDSKGTSNAENNERHMNTPPTCPNVLTRRPVGGVGFSNNPYSLFGNNAPPRTPLPDLPPVQQPCYGQLIRQLEDTKAALKNPSPPVYTCRVNAETRLPSQPSLQHRALPTGNNLYEMPHPPILNNVSQGGWHDLATRGAAQNRAVAILQGELEDNMLKDIETCLQQMGFDDTKILHRPIGKISKEEVESTAASLVDVLDPKSNLLLVICEKDYGYIELDPDFLDKRIYSPVAKYNQAQNEKFTAVVKRCKIHEFDTRSLEGATLHVIIDGLDAHPLKHSLRLRLSDTQQDVMKSKWKDHSIPEDSNKNILDGPMGQGNVVQFWVSRDMHGYTPFLLLKATLCICLEEPELPYQILLLRLKTILHKTLDASLFRNPSFCEGNSKKGVRCLEGMVVLKVAVLIPKCVSYLYKLVCEKQRKQAEGDIYNGNCILSSVDKFDPHLSLKLNWKY